MSSDTIDTGRPQQEIWKIEDIQRNFRSTNLVAIWPPRATHSLIMVVAGVHIEVSEPLVKKVRFLIWLQTWGRGVW